jgi:2-polyprenyl-3-methyl-5-hydroxy-6-metoxy-1,4-benzoquinol methylase
MSPLLTYRVPDRYYEHKLDRLLSNGHLADATPQSLFRAVSDEFWLWLHVQGVRVNPRLRQMLPGMPDAQIQLQANGLSGDRALQDGLLVYRLIKNIYETVAGDLQACQAVLDFGCGWGRVTRFFLREVAADRMWGVDHYDKAIDVCRQTNRWQNFKQIKPFPPTDFASGTFDLIFAYSVFSHLSERAQLAWVDEFARLLRPGGALIVTTWDRELIVRCGELRAAASGLPSFQTHLPTMFKDTARWLAAYDNGDFCFDTSVESYGTVSSYLGEACVPKEYVLNHWNRQLRLFDFINDRTVCPQNVIVAVADVEATAVASASETLVRVGGESGQLGRVVATARQSAQNPATNAPQAETRRGSTTSRTSSSHRGHSGRRRRARLLHDRTGGRR